MTIDQLSKYKYWYDENGYLWKIVYFIEQPSAKFERVEKSAHSEFDAISGGIHCHNFEKLKPVEIENLQ